MDLLLRALINLIQSEKIYVPNSTSKEHLVSNTEEILKILEINGWKWAQSEVFQLLTITFGSVKAHQVGKYLRSNYGEELTEEEDSEYLSKLDELEEEIINSGQFPGVSDGSDAIHKPDYNADDRRKENMYNSNHNSGTGIKPNEVSRINNSYSGSDMVVAIKIPGRAPVVFGELSSLSYSIFREKVPVRSLGRVSMKGYARGMRTITGILSFAVFDHSIVYELMNELYQDGYKILMDEMPLFDIVVSMANEFGSKSELTIYGVSTYTEGMSLGIEDIYLQNIYEFYALDIDPIARVINY